MEYGHDRHVAYIYFFSLEIKHFLAIVVLTYRLAMLFRKRGK